MPSKWNAPLKPWARKSPQTSASTANRSTGFRCPRRSTWVSMERGSLCELRNSGACLVKGMVPRKLGKSNSAPSGVRNRSIAMATRSAMRDRSAIRQPSKVLSFRTSPNNVLPLLNVSGAKPSGAVSPRPRVPRHSEMVPPGSGIWSRNYFLAPSRSLTAFMPSSTSVSSAKLSMVPSLRAPPSGPNEDMKNSIAEGSVHCSPPFAGGGALRRGAPLSDLFPDQPRADALSRVPRPRLVYFDRSGGGGLQGSYRHSSKTSRNALDRARFQRHHCVTLFEAQRALSRFLGAQNRTVSSVTYNFPDVHPGGSF